MMTSQQQQQNFSYDVSYDINAYDVSAYDVSDDVISLGQRARPLDEELLHWALVLVEVGVVACVVVGDVFILVMFFR